MLTICWIQQNQSLFLSVRRLESSKCCKRESSIRFATLLSLTFSRSDREFMEQKEARLLQLVNRRMALSVGRGMLKYRFDIKCNKKVWQLILLAECTIVRGRFVLGTNLIHEVEASISFALLILVSCLIVAVLPDFLWE